jgi:hypothetical protein
MWEAGDSIWNITASLDMPLGSARTIIRKFETEAALSARSDRFLGNIRRADDPDKKWKVSYVIQALRLKTITQNAVIQHYEWAEVPEVSLREIMDLAIPERDHPKPGYLITPLLDFRCVGLKGFWSVVSRLSESNLGEKCNEEWRKRLTRLRQASRIVGVHRTWSKPCSLPPWLLRPEVTEANAAAGILQVGNETDGTLGD